MMAHPPDDPHGGSLTPRSDPFGTVLDAARWFTERECIVFPCDRPGPGPCRGMHGPGKACAIEDRGKHPMVKWSQVVGPVPDDQLVEWFGADRANLAIACGPSGLLVVDEDRPGAFAAYAASVGQAVPDTFTVITGRHDGVGPRGRHFYFAAPDVALGNSAGRLPEGLDVRGGHGHGGYVIGPGSMHWTGERYEVEHDTMPADAPEWLVAALVPVTGPPAADGGGVEPREGLVGRARAIAAAAGVTVTATDLTRWADVPRYGSERSLRDEFAVRCAALTEGGSTFYHGLFTAAEAGWRLVELGLLDETALMRELTAAVWRVWDTEDLDENDHEHIVKGHCAAIVSPWELRGLGARDLHERSRVPDTAPAPVTSDDADAPLATVHTIPGNRTVTDVTESEDVDSGLSNAEIAARQEAEAYAIKVRDRVEWLDIQREAARVIEARDCPPIEGTDAVAFFAGDPPEYLVPGMVHRNGIAVMFGAPHCGKSFVALDIALSFASGKPWAGGEGAAITLTDGSPGVVHYVMAEAEGTNIGRGNAWFAYHGITAADLHGRFIPVTKPFLLTEAQVPLYLPLVIHDKPKLIIFDTRNAMFGGKESQAEDYGEMVRALRMIREAAGGCALLVIDHSGLNAPNRIRGSNAWEGATDTIVKVAKDKESGLHYVTMDRDRTAPEDGPEWTFRRERVRVRNRDEAVLVALAQNEDAPRIHVPGWEDDLPLPVEGTDKIDKARLALKGGKTQTHPGRNYAKVIWQLLRSTDGDPLLQTRIRTMINDVRSDKKDHLKAWAISRGCALLLQEGMAIDVGTAAQPRYVVAEAYSKREMPE